MSAYRWFDCEKCGPVSSVHPVRHIEHARLSACVDEEIDGLILACWKAGVRTEESCQDFWEDGFGDVFISFPSVRAYVRFATFMVDGVERDVVLDRITGFAEPKWDWSLSPGDAGGPEGPVVVGMMASVVIPRCDLAAAEGRLKSHALI